MKAKSKLVNVIDEARKLSHEELVSLYVKAAIDRDNAIERAHSDALTGVFNVRGFKSRIQEIAEHYPNVVITLMYIDIDNFKLFNDQFGHHVGDRVLKKITNILMHEMYSTDRLFRIGGDEFIILGQPRYSADTKVRTAKEIKSAANRFCKAIAGYGWESVGLPKVTITLGVSIGRFDKEFDTFSIDNAKKFQEGLKKRADDDLLKSKRENKRNTVAEISFDTMELKSLEDI